MLDWKQADLAKVSGHSELSVKNVEKGQEDPRMSPIQSIRSALEAAGALNRPKRQPSWRSAARPPGIPPSAYKSALSTIVRVA
ncbi:helix-turn-helix domain-containing protein [Ensifer adhaerens]|uniref:helix-turn-helix domain-containing protein n=1 Tax=Ensifer adhaerens TaxID=106592 RepID=UPI0039C99D12